MCGGGSDGGAAKEAKRQREEAEKKEADRLARIETGKANIEKTFAPFNDAFYQNRAQAYIDYAKPQLEDEYKRAARDLTYALARQRIQSSSEAVDRGTELDKRNQLALATIGEQGKSYANQARQAVEAARGDLLSLNSSSADPTLVSANAIGRAGTLSAMPAFNSIGTLLGDITAGLATQASLERRGMARYNTGLFNSPRNAQRIVDA